MTDAQTQSPAKGKPFTDVKAVYTKQDIKDFFFNATALMKTALESGAEYFVLHGNNRLAPASKADSFVFEGKKTPVGLKQALKICAFDGMDADDGPMFTKTTPREKQVTDRGNVEEPYFKDMTDPGLQPA